MPTIEERIIEVVREFPEATAADIASLIGRSHVKPELVHLTRRGVLERKLGFKERGGKKPYLYSLAKDCPQLLPTPKPRKATSTQLVRSLELRIDAQVQELLELRQWKANAIARYPELAVSPEVLKARKLFKQHYPEKGPDIDAGRYDDKPILRMLVEALEN